MGTLGNQVLRGSSKSSDKDTWLIESALAGVASGALKIPEGVISLGAELLDFGVGTKTAAKVEKFFDKVDIFEDKADDRWTGKITQLLTQFGVPIAGIRRTKMFKDMISRSIKAKKLDKYADLKKLGKEYGVYAGLDTFAADAGRLSIFGEEEEKSEGRADALRRLTNRATLGVEGFGWGMAIGQTARGIGKIVDDSRLQSPGVLGWLTRQLKGALPAEARDLERSIVDSNVIRVERDMRKRIFDVETKANNFLPRYADAVNGKTATEKKLFEDTVDKWLKAKPGKPKDILMKKLKDTAIKGGHNADDLENSLINLREGVDNVQKAYLGAKILGTDVFKIKDPKLRQKIQDSVGSHIIRRCESIELDKIGALNKYKPTAQQIKKAEQTVLEHFNKINDEAWQALGKEEREMKAKVFINDLLKGKKGEFVTLKKELDEGIKSFGTETLMRRKPLLKYKEIRDVLGEVKDPYANAMNTAVALEREMRKSQYLDELYEMGRKGGWIFDGATISKAGREYTQELKTGYFKSHTTKKGKKTILHESPVLPNLLEGKYTTEYISNAVVKAQKSWKDVHPLMWGLYQKFILGPKAFAQKAKTVYGPTTHIRNYSAGPGFLFMTGNFPNMLNPKRWEQLKLAHKTAFGDISWAGWGKANKQKMEAVIQDLIDRGLYNTSVRARDTAALVDEFMQGIAKSPGLTGKMMDSRISKLYKKFDMSATQLYMAEDNVWKQFGYMVELDEWKKIYPEKSLEELKNIAAERIRNTFPNYDKVGPWIKTIRQLPFGNFIAWPAELYRNTFNIMDYAIKDIKLGGKIGNKRLTQKGWNTLISAGMYTATVNYAAVEGAKLLYDVSSEQMDALRRFVPSWSENDTLVPLGTDKKGQLQYWNLSYQNPYDQVSRVFKTVINEVGTDTASDASISELLFNSITEAGSEMFEPFYSKSIWYKAVDDIVKGGGRDLETGSLIYREEDPLGEKFWVITNHLAEPFFPGAGNIKRFGYSMIDKTGRNYTEYEMNKEFAGLFGFKIMSSQPDIAMNFKTSAYNRHINNTRASFSNDIIRKGLTDPADIVREYLGAEKSRWKYQKDFYEDIEAAKLLGVNKKDLRKTLKRIAEKRTLPALKRGKYTPLKPPAGLSKQLRDISKEKGISNPYPAALREIKEISKTFKGYSLMNPNPFTSAIPTGLIRPKGPKKLSEAMLGINIEKPDIPQRPPIFDPNQNIAGAGAVDQRITVPDIKPKQDQAALVQRGKQFFPNDTVFNMFGAQGGEVRKYYKGGQIKK